MKILKSTTYRGLKADEANLAKVVEENKRLNGVIDYWQDLAAKRLETIAELEAKLAPFKRTHDPETGKFTASAEA